MCDEDLRIVQVGVHPAHLYVQPGKNLDWTTSDEKVIMSYRGRGPVWNEGSCSLDSVIVLGKLLQAGSTVIDRKGNRPQKWSRETKVFVEATNVNWEVLPKEVSIQIRHMFREKLELAYPFISSGLTWVTFASVTKELAQFQYHGRDYSVACACQGREMHSVPYSGNCVSHQVIDSDYQGVDVSTLVGRVWYGKQVFQCQLCGAQNGPLEERRIEQLPLRLVMNTMAGEHKIKIKDHTADFTIDYPDADGNMQTARYRWIGGIYHHNSHARVYFRDAARGEADFKEVGVYDSQLSSGVIMGGLPAHSATELIDPDWNETGMVITIYELVLNPSMDDLAAASAGLNAMSTLAQNNQSVLPGISPWQRDRLPISLSEKRTVPIAANRFYDVDRAGLPGPITAASNEMTVRSLATTYGCDGLDRTPNPESSGALNVAPQGNVPASNPLSTKPGLSSIWKSPTRATNVDPPQDPQDTIPDMTVEELKKAYPQFFNIDEITDPGSLAEHEELWPNGPPTPGGGSTNWPILPRVSPSVTPQVNSPMSITEEFLDLSAYDESNANKDERKTTRVTSTLGGVETTFEPLPYNPDWDVEMEDIQFENDANLQFPSLDGRRDGTGRWNASASQRARPSARPMKTTPVKVAKESESLRKRAMWNAMTEKKKVGAETKPRKAKMKDESKKNRK